MYVIHGCMCVCGWMSGRVGFYYNENNDRNDLKLRTVGYSSLVLLDTVSKPNDFGCRSTGFAPSAGLRILGPSPNPR